MVLLQHDHCTVSIGTPRTILHSALPETNTRVIQIPLVNLGPEAVEIQWCHDQVAQGRSGIASRGSHHNSVSASRAVPVRPSEAR